MKLNLFFIVMDLFTILIYPFVFIYGRLCQFSKARNVSVISPVTPGKWPVGNDEHKKER